MINRSNYEIYMIDYLDGRLNASEVSELLLFIEQHEDIRAEFELLQQHTEPVHADENISFGDKNGLKKPAYNDIKDGMQQQLIAYMEHDLSLADRMQIAQQQLIYPELKKDLELFEQTRFAADTRIVFPHKKQLKKQTIVVALFNRYAPVAAAACLLAFGIIVFYPSSQTNNQVADHKTTTSQPQLPAQTGGKPNTLQPQQNPLADNSTPTASLQNHVTGKATAATQLQVKGQSPALIAANGSSNKKQLQAQQKPHASAILKERLTAALTARSSASAQQLIDGKKLAEMKAVAASFKQAASPEFKTASRIEKDPATPGNDFYLPVLARIGSSIEKGKEEVVTEQNKPSEKKKFKFSDIGYALLNTFNKITGADIEVQKTYDEKGEVVNYSIASSNVEVSHSR